MGSEDGGSQEQPVHTVYLDSYWIYQTEVTNQMYARCMEIGNCDVTRSDGNLGDEEFVDYPVVEVNWYEAVNYCEWAGGRLPTEAEWEKASRGDLEGKLYPWGDEDAVCDLGAKNGAQYSDCDGAKLPVGSFAPNGYGLYDMAGNVWEWVADWFSTDYYASSPKENPLGPADSMYDSHGLRGGSWTFNDNYLRNASRGAEYSDTAAPNIGFRCASSAPP